MLRTKVALFLMGFIISFDAFNQEITIELGPDEIALNQVFQISVTVHNARLTNYTPFPEIDGFVKRGTQSSSSTNFINGQRSSTQSIIQNYVASGEGEFVLKPFQMEVNGKSVRSQGKKIKVGAPVQQRRRQDPFGYDPFQDFFGRNQAPQEFVDVKADAFLALTTDKSEVYLGDGFTLTLALYVSDANRAEMKFYQLSQQLPEIIKKIKPANCWEENFDIENITPEPVMINGKPHKQYKIFQSAYYPLNTDKIKFPSVGLELVKYKQAKRQSFFGRNRQETVETFHTKPKTVVIKELPPHPLRESVNVGNFSLQEKVSSQALQTGESFNYSFNIVGEGNISSIKEPTVLDDDNFDLYPPNVRQNINRGQGRVKGVKSFTYYGIPNEPGSFDLDKYFSWIFFNTRKEQYDTLRSDLTLLVKGESKKNEFILANDMGSFYDTMDLQDNQLYTLDERDRMRMILNFIMGLMVAGVAIVFFKK